MAPDALPVAPNHAALSNRIATLLASQSSLLKTLNPSSSRTPSSAPKTRPSAHNPTQSEKDDEDLFKNAARPNEGVGYTAPKSASADQTKADRELRGRILGKRGKEIEAQRRMGRGRRKEEESEDEDLGRSALGKRKRPRREAPMEEPVEVEAEAGEEKEEEAVEAREEKKDGEGDGKEEDVEMQDAATSQTAPSANRRKKNKKKNKAKAA